MKNGTGHVVEQGSPVVEGTKHVGLEPVASSIPAGLDGNALTSTQEGLDPMLAMMERLAVNKDVDVEKMRALIAMKKDIMAVQAKAAFDSAFSRMQPRIPTIVESAKTDKATYAPLEDIVEQVRPILSEFGFAINHRTEFLPDGKIKIVGKLKHEQGHAEESEFVCAADQSGSKNAIQALGSSNHYGRRYTTKDLLNIVTKGGDDDGKKAVAINLPKGFSEWLESLQAAALLGTKAMSDKWQASPKIFTDAILARDWEAIKAAARQADKSAEASNA